MLNTEHRAPNTFWQSAFLYFATALSPLAAVLSPQYENIDPGIAYAHVTNTNEPWSIHIVRIDRAAKGVELLCTHAHDHVAALATVAEQAVAVSNKGRKAVAAVNGDFFVIKAGPYQGDPLGLEITDGELLSAPKDACFWLDHGVPHINVVRGEFTIRWPDGSKSRFGLNEAPRANGLVLFTPAFSTSTRATNSHEIILKPLSGSRFDRLRANERFKAQIEGYNANGNSPLGAETYVLTAGLSFNKDLGALPTLSTLELDTTLTKNLSKAEMAIGGGPILVHAGEVKTWTVKTNVTTGLFVRNPRTAVGYNR